MKASVSSSVAPSALRDSRALRVAAERLGSSAMARVAA